MRAFAELLDALVFTPQRNAKLRLLDRYFRSTRDPDRGYGLAVLTGGLAFPHARPGLIRKLAADRSDPLLFAYSYDFVGDLAETVALIWPEPEAAAAGPPPSLTEVVERLAATGKDGVEALISGWLDRLDTSGRFALLKLITGSLRVGVSARLAKTALAGWGGVGVDQVEEVWHGQAPPYLRLFAWLDGGLGPPPAASRVTFRPMMLAHPLAEDDLARLSPADFAAEWKWDGIRVELAAADGMAALFSRTGDDVAAAFPDVAARMRFDAVLDGELLVVRGGDVAPFNDLQQRLGRKTPAKALLARYPAHVRLYDILFEGAEDLRVLPFVERRRRLEAWYDRLAPEGMDLSPLLPFGDWEDLARVRAGARANGIEGLMLKRRDSPYLGGRPKGPWFKWKRDPLSCDCVLMYAQRGHGKRSSFYSDYTFGCWRQSAEGAPELVPVGKAYFGFTDEELGRLDRWVRANTVERFGPVRQVAPGLVLEIAFDAVQPSPRHKSQVAMRFPRVHRIRWDKPAAEADRIETLLSLIPRDAG